MRIMLHIACKHGHIAQRGAGLVKEMLMALLTLSVSMGFVPSAAGADGGGHECEADLLALTDEFNAACCGHGASCDSGVPGRCDAGCAEIWDPFYARCRQFVDTTLTELDAFTRLCGQQTGGTIDLLDTRCDLFVTANASHAAAAAPPLPSALALQAQHEASGTAFASIDAARDAVRDMIAESGSSSAHARDLMVCLGPGIHSVSEGGLVFDAADSPHTGQQVIWRGSTDKANPSIVSGGAPVTGWTQTDLYGGGSGGGVTEPPAPPATPGTTGTGTCGVTMVCDTPKCCDIQPTGSMEAAANNISTLAECVAKARPCAMGNFVSFSKPANDCSWYQSCDMGHLQHPGSWVGQSEVVKGTWPSGSTVYAAPVPRVAQILPAVRQLWVGGVRANRTVLRTPGCQPGQPGCEKDMHSQCSFGYPHTDPPGLPSHPCPPLGNMQCACPPSKPHCVGFFNGEGWGHCASVSGATFAPWVTKANATAKPTAVGFMASEPLPESWTLSKNTTRAIEFAWPVVIHDWTEPRCTVASVVGRNVTLAAPCGLLLYALLADGKMPPPVRIEAVPPSAAAPLLPGQFFHDVDAGSLYYRLLPGQTTAELRDAWVASEEVIMSYRAGASRHRWEGVNFQYSTWTQPNSEDGYVDNQATTFYCTPGTKSCNMGYPLGVFGEALGAVQLVGARNVSFLACQFSHVGSAYALSVLGSSKDVTVEGCLFTDLSGGFLKLGSVSNDNSGYNQPGWDERFLVRNNTARDQAIEYGGAPGYFGGWVSHAEISHNTISDAGYSGMSQGWGWGNSHAPGYGNITITYNKVFNVMQKMRDGGGIYLNGDTNAQYTNTVSRNWVDNDDNVFGVYYLDQGASHWIISQNVATSSPKTLPYIIAGYNINCPCRKPPGQMCTCDARSNSVDHLWFQHTVAVTTHCSGPGVPECGMDVDEASLFSWPAGQALPPAAQAIMAAAGAT